jgi:hypothetical protein
LLHHLGHGWVRLHHRDQLLDLLQGTMVVGRRTWA